MGEKVPRLPSKAGEKSESLERCECKYTLQSEADLMRLVFECRETAGPANLNEKSCRANVLSALALEPGIDGIVLADYVEAQYGGAAIELLRGMATLGQELGRLSIRDPIQHYFSSKELPAVSLGRQKAMCQACPHNPTLVFPTLEKMLVASPVRYYTEFAKIAKALDKPDRPDTCNPCLAATRADLVYAFGEAEKIRAKILYEGFRIVESEDPR